MKKAPVFILGFDQDGFVRPEQKLIQATKVFYKYFESNIASDQQNFIHTMPTDIAVTDYAPKVSCDDKGGARHFLSNCGYDTAGKVLGHLLKNIPINPIKELKPAEADWMSKGVLRQFAQKEFLGDADVFTEPGFDANGWVYYPNNCVDGTTKDCKVHLCFHGTGMGYGLIVDSYIRKSGWLEYAAANDLILIFP